MTRTCIQSINEIMLLLILIKYMDRDRIFPWRILGPFTLQQYDHILICQV